jgi:hypothetical protein
MNERPGPRDERRMTRLLGSSVVLWAMVAMAEPQVAGRPSQPQPFAHRFGIAGYAMGWAGSYGGGGVGGRIRFEAFPRLGLDLFGEAVAVAVPRGFRHDHPIGFNLFVPFRVSQAVRLRALLGMCVTASFLHPDSPMAPRADTILVGAHVGGGVELALHSRLSAFLDGKAVAWWGNDRSVEGWTSATMDLRWSFVGQLSMGLMVHFG